MGVQKDARGSKNTLDMLQEQYVQLRELARERLKPQADAQRATQTDSYLLYPKKEALRKAFQPDDPGGKQEIRSMFETAGDIRYLMSVYAAQEGRYQMYRDINWWLTKPQDIMCAPITDAIQAASISLGYATPIKNIPVTETSGKTDTDTLLLFQSDALSFNLPPMMIFHRYNQYGPTAVDAALGALDHRYDGTIMVEDSQAHHTRVTLLRDKHTQEMVGDKAHAREEQLRKEYDELVAQLRSDDAARRGLPKIKEKR